MAMPATPAPMDIGFSPDTGSSAGATGALSSLFGTTPQGQQGSTGKAPSSGLWASISKWLGELDPDSMEEELKHIQQMVGGFNKVNSAAGQSQLVQRLLQEGKGAQQMGGEGVKPYQPMMGGATTLPQSGPNVTPEAAASMLRTMGLR